MPFKASKSRVKKTSASTKKPKPASHKAPAKSKIPQKRQAAESESEESSDDSDDSPKRKPRKRRKQEPEVHEDDQSDIIPEEVEEDMPEDGGEVSESIFACGV